VPLLDLRHELFLYLVIVNVWFQFRVLPGVCHLDAAPVRRGRLNPMFSWPTTTRDASMPLPMPPLNFTTLCRLQQFLGARVALPQPACARCLPALPIPWQCSALAQGFRPGMRKAFPRSQMVTWPERVRGLLPPSALLVNFLSCLSLGGAGLFPLKSPGYPVGTHALSAKGITGVMPSPRRRLWLRDTACGCL
jgi:hypothetical protein